MGGLNEGRCPACGTAGAERVLALGSIPVHAHVLHRSASSAAGAALGEFALAHCPAPDCGLLFNPLFDEARTDYEEEYDNALHGSGNFRAYQHDLAEDLVRRHALAGKSVVELGCGDGSFLRALRAAGAGSCTGYDPTATPSEAEDVRIVRGLGRHLDEGDFLVCRHVLEHIPDPIAFLQDIAVRPCYFEVPDVRWTVDHGGLWDLLYEHCCYYAPWSLAAAFARSGFSVTRTTAAYGGQFLQAECVAAEGTDGDVPAPAETACPADWTDRVAALGDAHAEAVGAWQGRFEEWRGARVALWGAGSKGVMLLNTVAGADAVGVVVDVNPRKQGCFVAGTGHPIVPPTALPCWKPDVVVLLNPVYREEIAGMLRQLDVDAEICS